VLCDSDLPVATEEYVAHVVKGGEEEMMGDNAWQGKGVWCLRLLLMRHSNMQHL